MSGTDQLREQLAAMQSSLQAFDAPVVDEHAGLRLMAETLREREAHIKEQIARNETCTITLTVRNVAQDAAVPAALVASVITAVDAAVAAAAHAEVETWDEPPAAASVTAAVTLHLRDPEIGSDVALTLTRPPGPLAAQLAQPGSERPLADVVMSHVTDTLADVAAGAAPDVTEDLAQPLRALADLVITAGTVLQWRLEAYESDARSLTIDQPAAQRMVHALPS